MSRKRRLLRAASGSYQTETGGARLRSAHSNGPSNLITAPVKGRKKPRKRELDKAVSPVTQRLSHRKPPLILWGNKIGHSDTEKQERAIQHCGVVWMQAFWGVFGWPTFLKFWIYYHFIPMLTYWIVRLQPSRLASPIQLSDSTRWLQLHLPVSLHPVKRRLFSLQSTRAFSILR